MQGLPSSHLSRPLVLQTPAVQASPVVQTLPSVQGAVSSLTLTQPEPMAQLSLVQGLRSSQLVGPPDWQEPPLQASPAVQGLLSVHGMLLSFCTQPLMGSHESSVQGLASAQFRAEPGLHTPATHMSPSVHKLLSLQKLPLLVLMQPLAWSQLSSVQGFLSSQFKDAPPTQLPPEQASAVVQALPSVQGPLRGALTQPTLTSQESLVQT